MEDPHHPNHSFLHQEKIPRYSLQQFNTHDHFVDLMSFSVNSHILSNEEFLAFG